MRDIQTRDALAPTSVYCRAHNRLVRDCPHRGGAGTCPLRGDCPTTFSWGPAARGAPHAPSPPASPPVAP